LAETAPAAIPSLTDSIGFSWRLVWKKPESILVLFVAQLCAQALTVPAEILAISIEFKGGRDAQVIGALIRVGAAVLNFPVAAYFAMGMTRYALRLARGENAEFKDIFSGGPYLNFMLATLLVGLGTFFGLLFCIVPGIILSLAWVFTGQSVLDRNLGPIDAMKNSWNLTNGHRWDLLLLLILLTGVNILGLLACCVGLFVTTTMTFLAIAWAYLRLSGQETAAVQG
jgi:uncharacterized membrane protein